MLVDNETLKQIDRIIERAYTTFAYRIIGDDFLTDEQKIEVAALGLIIGRKPLIELLYWLVRQRGTPGYRADKTLQRLLDEISSSGILPSPTPEARYTVEHAKATIKQALDVAKEDFKKKIKDEVLKTNTQYKETQATTLITSLNREQQKKQESTSKLFANLKKAALVGGVLYMFRREFTSALTNMINSATLDGISREASSKGQPPAQQLVWKEVVNDDRLSPECRRLHTHPDGSPRLYTLQELIENGTNAGKSKSQWKAVIGGTHPNCRCTLREASASLIESDQKRRSKI